MAAEGNQEVRTLEQGHVYFLYRPRVEEHEPTNRSDLQQLYMVLFEGEWQ